MVAITGGFFGHKAPAAHVQKKNKKHVIDVGGELFRALATSFIDYLISYGTIPEDVLKIILRTYATYFPNTLPKGAYLRPKERMDELLKSSNTSELVERIAYVLRQLVVDEFYANPEQLGYRTVFNIMLNSTSQNHLREMHTVINEVAVVAALSKVLHLVINRAYKTRDKVLRKLVGDHEHLAALTIQIQGTQYYPVVKHKEMFKYVGQLAITAKPVINEHKGTLAEILGRIDADNKRVLARFSQQQKKLNIMVAAGDVKYKHLIDLYVALLPPATEEADTVLELEYSEHHLIADAPVEPARLLVDALASWVAAGLVTEEALYELMEKNTLNTTHTSQSR